MSFIHNISSECPKNQLDFFSLPPTQLSMEISETVCLSPASTLENLGPIEFQVPETEDYYIDPSETYLYMVVSVCYESGDKLAATDKVTPVNLFLHSMFSEISVYINSKLLTPPNLLYPYRAYFEHLFNYGSNAKESHLTAAMFVKDSAGRMNNLDTNAGALKRRSYIAESKQVSIMGKITPDIFGQSKYLPNNLPMKLVFTRSKPEFCLIAAGDKKYSIQIHKAELQLRRVKINPSILLAHSKVLATTTAKYPITRIECKTFTISSGGLTFEHKLFSGQEPVRVIVALTSNKAQSDIKENPFNFGHFNMNYLALTRNGVPVTTRPIQPSFDTTSSDYIQSYINTFRATGIGAQDDGYQVSRDDYGAGGYVIHCFDLTADQSASLHQWSLRRHSLIEISLRFTQAIPETLSCIVYGEFQNLVEIDANRRVTTDF